MQKTQQPTHVITAEEAYQEAFGKKMPDYNQPEYEGYIHKGTTRREGSHNHVAQGGCYHCATAAGMAAGYGQGAGAGGGGGGS